MNHELLYLGYEWDLVNNNTILIVSGLTFDIPGTEKDCQIYFLWTKKTREDSSEVSGRQEEINDLETESGSGEPTYQE